MSRLHRNALLPEEDGTEMPDTTDRTLAQYLLDGLNVNNHAVTGTTLSRTENGLHVARVQVDGKEWVEGVSPLEWFKAAESAVRRVLWRLSEENDND